MAWFRRKKTYPVTIAEPSMRRQGLFGRRYMVGSPYLLPSDDQEIHRLDFQHYLLRYAFRGNFLAPVGYPQSILDVGCGTGRWAIELAHQFPRANVVGLDLVAPPPEVAAARGHETRPENFVFVQANVLERLPFGDASFDFVHQRLLFLAIPTNRWQGLISELVRVTLPGGWVELVEGSAVPPGSGPAIVQWGRWMTSAAAQRGIDFAQGSQVGVFLTQAGLVNVKTHEVRMQAGRQFGRLGAMLEANFLGLLGAIKPQIVGAGVATAEDYDTVVAGIRTDIANGHCFWHAYLAYGQRPRGQQPR